MTMNLDYLFPGIAVRRAHGDQQGLVKAVAGLGVADLAEVAIMRLQGFAWLGKEKRLARDGLCVGTAHANDRYSTVTRRGSNRGDCVMGVHVGKKSKRKT